MEQETAGFLEGISSGTAGITVGFTGAAENPELLAFAQGFRRRHPDISLEFRKGTFEEGRRQLLDSETDCCFGLAETFGPHDPIRAERLFRYELCIICSFDSPLVQKDCLTPEDLAHERFLALDESYGQGFHSLFLENLAADGIEPAGIEYVQSFDELVLGVSLGRGITIISRSLVRSADVAIRPFAGRHAESWYAAVWREGHESPELRLFLQEIRSSLRAHTP